MSNYISYFKEELLAFLDYKKNVLNQTIHPYDIYLSKFDKYCFENKIQKITKDVIENWLILGESENKNTQRLRSCVIKSFARYLNFRGIKAYVIDNKCYNFKTNYIPHIYTDEEISIFFKELDSFLKNSCYTISINKIQYKLFFKILYCCGMRDSELLNLKFRDIDFNNKAITIKKSKNDISRILFLNNDLINDLKIYYDKYCNSEIDNYVFDYKGKKRKINSFLTVFHKVIKKCNFNEAERYRIHDFRHTFAVKNLNIAFKNGIDTYVILPILMNYLGHSSLISTEYYLRFIPDVYPDVIEKLENNFKTIIPIIKENNYEE